MIVFIPDEIKKISEKYLETAGNKALYDLNAHFVTAADEYNDEKVKRLIDKLRDRYF